MSMEQIVELHEAKKVICKYCEYDGCEWCQINRVINAVDKQYVDEEYIPSSARGDYGPSNPWDAPGMSVRDFI